MTNANTAPSKVILAARLMWLIWATGAVFLISRLYLAVQLALPGIAILAIVYVIVLGLLAMLVQSVARGRNWARITYTVLAAIASFLIVVGQLTASEQLSIGQRLYSGLLVVGYAAIVWLLFQAGSRPWFKKSSEGAT
jgi:hypothetical protein